MPNLIHHRSGNNIIQEYELSDGTSLFSSWSDLSTTYYLLWAPPGPRSLALMRIKISDWCTPSLPGWIETYRKEIQSKPYCTIPAKDPNFGATLENWFCNIDLVAILAPATDPRVAVQPISLNVNPSGTGGSGGAYAGPYNPYYYQTLAPSPKIAYIPQNIPVNIKCECGTDKVGGRHSNWCPKAEKRA